MKISRIVQFIVIFFICLLSYLLFSNGSSDTGMDAPTETTP